MFLVDAGEVSGHIWEMAQSSAPSLLAFHLVTDSSMDWPSVVMEFCNLMISRPTCWDQWEIAEINISVLESIVETCVIDRVRIFCDCTENLSKDLGYRSNW